MRLLEMGDDTACALGVSVERSRLLMMLVAVVLTAAATALAGPISFIALVAPHIARRISGTARWGLTQAALCGALKTQRILGASLLCVDSHEMINIVKMVMDAGLPYSILRDHKGAFLFSWLITM